MKTFTTLRGRGWIHGYLIIFPHNFMTHKSSVAKQLPRFDLRIGSVGLYYRNSEFYADFYRASICASTVLGVVILSVRLSVRHTRL